jgi:transposase InsO family protein
MDDSALAKPARLIRVVQPDTILRWHRAGFRALLARELRRLRAMGIRDRAISPQSPWQNPYAERLTGSLRRDCLDHVLIFGERHLRGILSLYAGYYNETRTHVGLGKDAPLRRAIQRSGTIVTTPILSGSHHRYARI